MQFYDTKVYIHCDRFFMIIVLKYNPRKFSVYSSIIYFRLVSIAAFTILSVVCINITSTYTFTLLNKQILEEFYRWLVEIKNLHFLFLKKKGSSFKRCKCSCNVTHYCKCRNSFFSFELWPGLATASRIFEGQSSRKEMKEKGKKKLAECQLRQIARTNLIVGGLKSNFNFKSNCSGGKNWKGKEAKKEGQ